MAVTLNAKGTSVPYFKIGKSGVTLYQGLNDPHVSDGYAVRTNDIWFDTNVRTLKFRTSENTWQALAEADKISEMTDVDLSGLADGHFLRYNGLANTWEAHEVTGGLASDWGSISENSISYDGYTGDVWQLETSTNTLSHVGPVAVTGPVTVNGPLVADAIHASNLYTDADARSAISATGSISYDSSTGVFSFTDTDSSYATKVGYNLADETDTASIVLDPGDGITPATFRGDVVDNNGNVIVDVSSASATFSGGLMGNIYGDVYDISGANKVLESGTNNLDSSLTVDTANATTLNSGTTNISGNAVFTGSSADFTGTTTIGNWNGAVYDRTGQTLIIDDTASPKPIVYANIQGGVVGDVQGNVVGNVDGNVTGNLEGNIINSQGQVVIDNSGALYPTVIQLPKGVTADRPSPATAGMMFFNESTMKFEGYDGTNWIVFSPEDWGSI